VRIGRTRSYVLIHASPVVKPFAHGSTLDLVFYESLNVIWKEYVLLKRIDVDTTLEFLDLIGKVFKVANVQSVSGLEERSSI